ncbi:MAG: GGDEF domain-containing protein [Pseudomonadota bacterium]
MKRTTMFLGLIYANTASAALPGGVGIETIGGGVLALIAAVIALRFFVEKRSLTEANENLTRRVTDSERAISELQVERGRLERALEDKQSALDSADAERSTALASLDTLKKQVERVARIDSQTGVANDQHFLETLGEEIKRAIRHKKPVSILIGELDLFEQYVEDNGGERAVTVLRTIASSVTDTFRRAGDLVARVGDARFAVVLPEADEATGQRFAERLRKSVYDLCVPFPSSEAADRLTISVGLTTLPPTRLHERHDAVARAVAALQHAQSCGYNRVASAADAA